MRKIAYEQDDAHFSADAYTVKGWRGIAWTVLGWERDSRRRRVVAVMVGDDEHHSIDERDLTPLARRDYCGGCGQVGCCCDGVVRSEGA